MNNLKVSLSVENQTKYILNIRRITKCIESVLEQYRIIGKIELGISLVKPNKIRQLNKKYRQINTVTDVLSFPINDKIAKINPKLPINNLGDVIVCPDQAEVQVKEKSIHNWSRLSEHDQKQLINKEVEFLINHGLLHLIGIHHKE